MGLLGMMARTAVVAGTATAVSGRVSRRQQAKYQQKADAEAYNEQQAEPQEQAPPQYQQAPPQQYQQPQYQQAPPQYQQPQYQQPQYQQAPPQNQEPAPAAEPSLVDEIQRLSALKDQGILSADEFAAAKSKLLGL